MQPNNQRYNLGTVLNQLRDASYFVGVFGEFSTGKSTFLNALMGEDILSVATEPTTATPTRIQFARVFNVLVYGFATTTEGEPPLIASLFPIGAEPVWARLMKDGVLGSLQHEVATIRRFLERWTTEGQDASQTQEVVIQLPQPFLKGRIALIDTPGVNNEFTKHQGITERVLERVDLALCLVDARQGGKSSEMSFIQAVAQKSALTRVVVNKIDLIDEEERVELMESIHEILQSFWPSDRGPCPAPWVASSLASLDPEFRSRFPQLAEGFNQLRTSLTILAESQRSRRILSRCGNWDLERMETAHHLSEEGRYGEAHECLLDVLTLYQEAELEIPDDLPSKISLCEEAMKGATSRINEAHALVDRVALHLLRNEPNEEMRQLIRKAGEIFEQAQVRDSAFEKLAKDLFGAGALLIGRSPNSIIEKALTLIRTSKEISDHEKGVKLLEVLAETGHPEAQYQLGLWWVNGGDFYPNYKDPTPARSKGRPLAMTWLQKASEQGHAAAQAELGICFANGNPKDGSEKDEKQAFALFSKSARSGNATGQLWLGFYYQMGYEVPQDWNLAVHWYSLSSTQGEPESQYLLGLCYQNGTGVPQDHVKAFLLFQDASTQGHRSARLALSLCYANGTGTVQDWVNAHSVLVNMESWSLSDLRDWVPNSKSVPVNQHMALSYYQLAADQGNPIAQEQLALYYLQHEQDPVKAATEARRLAENDHPKCAGIRVLQKMAESKVPEAQFQLAECFLYGAGVSESPSDAFFWFLQAAEQNHVEAQFMVGGFYLEGHGIHKDPNQAKRWLGIAAKSGHENAAEALSTIPGGPYAIGNCPRCGQKLKAGATRCWEGCNWPDPPPPAVRKDLICPKCRQPLGAGVSRCWTTGCDYIVR